MHESKLGAESQRTWPLPGTARLMADMDKDLAHRNGASAGICPRRQERGQARLRCQPDHYPACAALTGLLAGGQADGQAEIRGFCLDARTVFGQNRGIWSTFLNSGATNR